MDEDVQIQSHWTVDEALKHKPETSLVFIKNRMQCVGCFMQKFCSIKLVAEIYQVDLNKLLQDLNDFVIQPTSNKEK